MLDREIVKKNPRTCEAHGNLYEIMLYLSLFSTISNIVLGIIIAGIIIAGIVIGFFAFVFWAVGSGIAYKNETESSAWEYWEKMKTKRWGDLSEDEKEKLILANLVIANDVGVVVKREQLVKMLEEQLPITEPHVGLSYPIKF